MKRLPGLYRPNVAMLMRRADGHILICERSKHRGSWQFPQGGIDEGESPQEALVREAEEEIGLIESQYCIVEERGLYLYNYPQSRLAEVHHYRGIPYIGQEQTYFLCDIADGIEPVVDQREFCAYTWMDPSQFNWEWLPSFKREVYRRVLEDFFPGYSL